jgi:hypothetical protein
MAATYLSRERIIPINESKKGDWEANRTSNPERALLNIVNFMNKDYLKWHKSKFKLSPSKRAEAPFLFPQHSNSFDG